METNHGEHEHIKHLISEISHKDEVNLLDLVENVKNCLKADDVKNALFYLNLAMFTKDLDLTSKIALMSMSSLANFKIKNQNLMMKIVRKIFKFEKQGKMKETPNEMLIIFVKILQKSSQVCEEKGNYLYSCWFLYLAKSIYDGCNVKGEESTYDTIKNGFPKVMQKITNNMSEKCEELLNNKTSLLKIIDYFNSSEKPKIQFQANESYYLISSKWVANMNVFLKFISDPNIENINDSLFNTKNVCLLYFDSGDEDEEEVRNDVLGSYPGVINNFMLTTSADCWTDPEEAFSNVYLCKEAKETSDYLIIPKDIYSEIKSNFSVIHEIERRCAIIDNTLQIDADLKKIKVLFINEIIREKYKELLVPKNIQISRYSSYAQLENKILRVFKNLLKEDNMEHDFKIYKYESHSKEIYELIVSYVNRKKTYKMVIKEMKRSENIDKTISELKIGNKDILIVEAIPKNMIVSPFIRIKTDTVHCFLCKTKVDLKTSIQCDNCTQQVYCCLTCKSGDTLHLSYHRKISNLNKKRMTAEEVLSFNISDLFDANSKAGLVGLKNFGNTCFINSALQCLSHCEDLTKYFLSRFFLDDINKQRGLSSDGRISNIYYELLNELWVGSAASFAPAEFKNMFLNFLKQFQGGNQYDVKDMMLFIFDRLHEDLNRIKAKPTLELSEQGGNETDEEASKRWSSTILSRENSIIVDLFHGQYRTQIRCPGCKRVSVTYEPFMCLPLPIPDKSVPKIRFKVFPNNYEYKFFVVEVYDVTKHTKIIDVKNKIKENFSYRNSEFDSLLLKNKIMNSLLPDEQLIYEFVFTKVDFSEEDFIDTEIVFCEVETSNLSRNKGDFVTFFISPSEFFDETYYLLLKSKNYNALTYPKAFSINKKSRVKDLYIEIYKYFRRAMNDMINYGEKEAKKEAKKEVEKENEKENEQQAEKETDTSYYEDFYSNIKNKEYIEKDFDKLFLGLQSEIQETQGVNTTFSEEPSDSSIFNQKAREGNEGQGGKEGKGNNNSQGNPLFELFIYNNIPSSNSYFFRKPACEYCKSHCAFCKIKLDLKTKIHELYAMQQVCRPFFLMADFSSFKEGFFKFYDEFVDYNDPRNSFKGELTLYDCLDQFKKEEKFAKEQPWFCDYCEKTLEAFKKVEIYSAPKYLVVQLKRFKLKGHKSLMELVNNKKNETFVYYPKENFDLSNNIVGPNKEVTYELVAVSQHTGGLQGGHFTTLAKNKEWVEFDDETVKVIESDNIINSNAYLLLYKRIEKVLPVLYENKILDKEYSINNN